MNDKTVSKSRLRWSDLLGAGSHGLRARRARTLLTAVGITIGIAAMVSVVGLSASSSADLLHQLDKYGTNLLAVRAGSSAFGEATKLPESAPSMIRRIPPVEEAAALTAVDASVRRNDLVPAEDTSGITVYAAENQVVDTLQATLAEGRFLDQGTSAVPAVVLGSVAAERLGVTHLEGGPLVYLNGHWFSVIGILDAMPLNADLDRAAFVGYEVAKKLFGAKANASIIYLRAHPDQVAPVRGLLAATANPEAPNETEVSRPSDTLKAKAAVAKGLEQLLLGLGGVALLVGGVGIANVMVISVLERRSEIGLRRAIGAKRGHVAAQFVTESILLAAIGGVSGVALGAAITRAYAAQKGWLFNIPAFALAGGVVAALVVGAVAGLYPAVRASRLDPAETVHAAG